MEDQDEANLQVEKEEIIVEKEWVRIERLLAKKNNAACSMAIVEVDKLFREVLGIVSFGETVHEAIANASGMFSDMKGLMEGRKVYEDIVEVPGFLVDKNVAKHITAIYLQAILDMLGKDYEDKGYGKKFVNELVYFSELHPKLLRNLLVSVLVFLVGVWFLADTAPGQWMVGLAVGFTRFVLQWVWGLVLIVLVVLGIAIISWLFFEKRKNR
ncbi:hypothetical protein KKE14_03050 [Patescibacteria group bacterium]|nr:hypothetical protein [Patescibacteria group bacterium]